jgi:GxxExxY protein
MCSFVAKTPCRLATEDHKKLKEEIHDASFLDENSWLLQHSIITNFGAMKTIQELCDIVRETSYAIHIYHGHGHLEKIYENALVNRLRKTGLSVEPQAALQVFDEDGTLLGEYFADLVVESELLVELKACKALADEHTAQLLGYLKSARRHHGLLINFGSYRFQIKKYVL